MKEQKLFIPQMLCFDPKQIFECGQCFRWNQQPDGSYLGVVKHTVLQVKKVGEGIEFTSMGEEELAPLVEEYFDLEMDYETIKETLRKVDSYLANSISYGEGIRILNQELWEIIISFIISANNNIPRIKGIVERIAQKYGDEIHWNKQTYYTFPTIEQLSKASVEELRTLGLGFRDKRVYEVAQEFQHKQVTIEALENEKDTPIVREMLLTLAGVGPKVADCILLFGMHRLEVFPIDVWVQRVMNELYFKEKDETKLEKRKIEQLAKEKYTSFAGIAQQYLFYWKRETA